MPLALIIEDRPEIGFLWEKALHALQMETVTATTMADAKRLSRRIPPPDLILLDLGLPDSRSKDTPNEIEDLKKGNPNVVVVVVSGLLTPEIVETVIGKGAHGAISKLEINARQDLWKAIRNATDKANAEGQTVLKATSDIIKKLTAALHLL